MAIRSRISRAGWPNRPERCVTLPHRSRLNDEEIVVSQATEERNKALVLEAFIRL